MPWPAQGGPFFKSDPLCRISKAAHVQDFGDQKKEEKNEMSDDEAEWTEKEAAQGVTTLIRRELALGYTKAEACERALARVQIELARRRGALQ